MCHQPQVFTASYLHLDFPIRGTTCTLCQPFLSHPIYNKLVNRSVTLECSFCKDNTFETYKRSLQQPACKRLAGLADSVLHAESQEWAVKPTNSDPHSLTDFPAIGSGMHDICLVEARGRYLVLDSICFGPTESHAPPELYFASITVPGRPRRRYQILVETEQALARQEVRLPHPLNPHRVASRSRYV
jgi:hypothetical protein